jgi:hypothetical protein
MPDNEKEFVAPDLPEGENADFYTESPKGVIRSTTGGAGSSVGGERAASAPADQIQENRDIAYTDPHVKEAMMTLLDWIVGDGFNIAQRSFQSAMENGVGQDAAEVAAPESTGGETESSSEGAESPEDRSAPSEGQGTPVQNVRRLLKTSSFWTVFVDWVKYAMIDGHAFMELVVEEGQFKPKLLPTKQMQRKEDKYGDLKFYKLQTPEGGGGGGDGTGSNGIRYEPHEIAELTFFKTPKEDFGRSMIEPIAEQADMLRDMEIDYARFIATKAYPPILWKLGDEDHNWTEEQVQGWMDNVEGIQPDTMLAAPHDVDTEVVGTTSTSSTAGAMRLEETFQHFENRVITGLGVPSLLMNVDVGGNAEATATMPSFKRRVTRLQKRVQGAVESQILMSLLTESAGLDTDPGVAVPEFQFGEHSSAEKRLEIDKLLNLLNNGMLKPEAFAERAGIDPEEVPEFWDSGNHMDNIRALARKGDQIQNPSGGSPTGTEGGAESAGGEVTSRQDSGADSSNGRNKKSVTEDES